MRPRDWKAIACVLVAALVLHVSSADAKLDISKRLPAQPHEPSSGTPPAGSTGGSGSSAVCDHDPAECLGVVGLACDGLVSTEAEAALVVASGAIGASAVVFAGSVLETAYSGCTRAAPPARRTRSA